MLVSLGARPRNHQKRHSDEIAFSSFLAFLVYCDPITAEWWFIIHILVKR